MTIHIPTNKTELLAQWAVVVLATYGAIRLAEDIAVIFDEHQKARRDAGFAASFKQHVREKSSSPVRVLGEYEMTALRFSTQNDHLRHYARGIDEGRHEPKRGQRVEDYPSLCPEGVSRADHQSGYRLAWLLDSYDAANPDDAVDCDAHSRRKQGAGEPVPRDWFAREDVDAD